jgi:hypothetical protein
MAETYITSDKESQQLDSSNSEGRFLAYNRDRLSAETWQGAIDFALERMDQLKTLVKIFGEYRDSGHPFPGERGKERQERAARSSPS